MNIENFPYPEKFPVEKKKLVERLERKIQDLIKKTKDEREAYYIDDIQKLSDQIIKIKADWYLGTPGMQSGIYPQNYYLTCYKPGTKKVELKEENMVLMAAFSVQDEEDDVEGDSFVFEYLDKSGFRHKVKIEAFIPLSSFQKFYDPKVFCHYIDSFPDVVNSVQYEPENMANELQEFYEESGFPFNYVYPTSSKRLSYGFLELAFTVREPNRKHFYKISDTCLTPVTKE